MKLLRQIPSAPLALVSLVFCFLMSRATLEEERGPSYERNASEIAWDIITFVLMVMLFVCLACTGLWWTVTTFFAP